ncbi:MAG: AMP-binding protein [Actinomycetota bacterium]|nr:AMP-binding protein [Actinomycetota bacterium]
MPTSEFTEEFFSRSPHSALIALRWRHQSVTYGQLHNLAERFASRLGDGDLPPSGPVMVTGFKAPSTIALMLALQLVGRSVLVPSSALGEQALIELASRVDCECLATPAAPLLMDGDALALRRIGRRRQSGNPLSAPARLLFTTSGSTGAPKVVLTDPAGINTFLAWAAEQFELTESTPVLSFAPLNFDLSLLDIWATLRVGGCSVLVDADHSADGHYLLDLLAEENPRLIQAVPMFFRLLDLVDPQRRIAFGAVQHVVSTGDALTGRLAEGIHHRFPQARIYNVYGCTETNDSFIHELQFGMSSSDHDGPVPIGRPIAGVEAEVRDTKDRAIRGPGHGELYVATPFQATNYLNSPEDEAEKFAQPNPGAPPYYRTGDLVTVSEDGTFALFGRVDFLVKVRGVRINLQEVEHVLNSHLDVLESVVLTHQDELAGQLLTCCIRRRPGSRLNSLRLRSYCGDRLERAAIPSVVHIIDQPLPRNPNGKIDRDLVRINLKEGTVA